MFRVGLGFDNHRLVEGRALWLGGVEVPAPVGELAHSDGDVLLHALTDALLGAVGAGDIGEHFPDSDPRWKDQASSHFVRAAADMVRDRGYDLVNLDATVFLEAVKLAPFKQAIASNLRGLFEGHWALDPSAVNVKAKTLERCDAVGAGEAVAAQVVVLLKKSTA
ncbi:MAG: 2-C-methyl-D-erythritol 2,4-cyclodiphosphate synthase [Planctomycetota bacterium]|nr:2-C-methyl-D-erythritol 2,4-cyclodiphosphate synthase [Planctomycetota bacterium]